MFKDFKQEMIKEFEMMEIGLMTYYLGIKVKQRGYNLYESRDIYKGNSQDTQNGGLCKSKYSSCVDWRCQKMMKEKKINSITFKSLVGILIYLTCTYPDICYGAGTMSRFMSTPIMTHFKTLKWIL